MKPEDVTLPTREQIVEEAKEALALLEDIAPKLKEHWSLGHETYLHIGNLKMIIKRLTDDPTLRYNSFRKVYAARLWHEALVFKD